MTDNRVAETGITHLQGLLEALEQDSQLPTTRRRDYCSAVRKIGALTGRSLDRLPAHLGLLRPHLEGVHPAMAGLSTKRRQNIRSDLKRAIEYARSQGLLHTPAREPLAPAWQALYDKLEGPQLRNGLSGFLRFCSHRGIDPYAVTDAVAGDYYKYVANDTLRKDPNGIYRDTCRLWNRAVARYDGFPDIPLMEDIALSTALRRVRRPDCIRQPRLLASSRRWETHGILRTIVLMWRLRLAFALGTPATALARHYR